MFSNLVSQIRTRWHPLWRLRQIPAFRQFQQRCDFTVSKRIPETDLKVAIKFVRDASWIATPGTLERQIRDAFTLVLDLLKPATFWDVGANIGFYSWFVRRHPAVREVIMFEPDPTNFGLVTKTIRQNALANCRVLNVALSDRSGEASFLLDRASGSTGSLEEVSLPDKSYSLHHAYQMTETITCRTATVDGLIAEGTPAPDLIKIDVEGAEHLVLAGAGDCLRERCPTMIIETSNAELIRRVRDVGYTVLRLDPENVLFVSASANADLTALHSAFAEYVE